MKGGMRAATAIGIGYVLGRRKKFRTATLMAAATAAGGTTIGGVVLSRGMKLLGNADVVGKVSPQLGEIADTVKADLLTAGKAAATAAVNNRIDTLTDSIHERAERVRNPGAFVEQGAGQAADEPDDRRGDEEADEAPPRRAASRRRSPVTRARR